MKKNVAILGASKNPDRYSYLAFKMLKENGYEVLPVTPKIDELEGVRVYASLDEIQVSVGTLTMYVGPDRSSALTEQILKLHPRRVIFNPGSENPDLARKLNAQGIITEEACTLVLLRTNQFEKN